MRGSVFVVLAMLAVAPQGIHAQERWGLVAVEPGQDSLHKVFHFENGTEYSPKFVFPEFVGAGHSLDTAYLLFEGHDCWDCDAGKSLYVVIPRENQPWEKERHPYPGFGQGWVVYRAQAYWGDCTAEDYDLVYRVYMSASGAIATSADWETAADRTERLFLVRIESGGSHVVPIAADSTRVAGLEAALDSGKCFEIPPLDHFAEIGF